MYLTAHHAQDQAETLFLNLFYGGRLAAMPPKLRADDGRNVVIRPLAYCRERDIEKYASIKDFPIIPCNLCGSQENLQRQQIKELLKGWEKEQPGRVNNIFRAIQNVAPSQLADTQLFDFERLQIDREGERASYAFAEELDTGLVEQTLRFFEAPSGNTQ